MHFQNSLARILGEKRLEYREAAGIKRSSDSASLAKCRSLDKKDIEILKVIAGSQNVSNTSRCFGRMNFFCRHVGA